MSRAASYASQVLAETIEALDAECRRAVLIESLVEAMPARAKAAQLDLVAAAGQHVDALRVLQETLKLEQESLARLDAATGNPG